ncbi:hypothetical protein EDE12_1068 [Methylosinus sp. sav-2]|jgi:UDP-N-acetylmuramyl pentapeptide phosphotransferase/UDP-N-acetylglucosamine-1-phosphate transferase|uniref:hypothetical protein n=1 Tax=Methylosinus sp. sav-2 TaxID=2485168 RepID=UPI000ADF1BF6|nr:hypothetical protein [Methylosinus sp. sav-2]TDX63866.1 hypothetical protein EDE12_1068 [Methylosinus sp. sav-2]
MAEATNRERDLSILRSDLRAFELRVTARLGGLTIFATAIILVALWHLPRAH